MSLEVGDKVEILGVKGKDGLSRELYCWNKDSMPEFIGKVATITRKLLGDDWYELDVDGQDNPWKESWLCKIEPEVILSKPTEVEATKTYTVTWEEAQEDVIERYFFGLRSRTVERPNKKFKASCNVKQKELIEKSISTTRYLGKLFYSNTIGKRLNIEIVQDLPEELEDWFSQELEKG